MNKLKWWIKKLRPAVEDRVWLLLITKGSSSWLIPDITEESWKLSEVNFNRRYSGAVENLKY